MLIREYRRTHEAASSGEPFSPSAVRQTVERALGEISAPGFAAGLRVRDIESMPAFGKLDRLDQKQALRAQANINACAMSGGIDLSKAKRIIDFGAGGGVPTVALKRLAELNGGSVDALEANPAATAAMVRDGILDAEHIHTGDGLAYLADMAEQGQKCDLITAFMLGGQNTDVDRALTSRFISAAHQVLAPEGHVIITSDGTVMRGVRETLQDGGFDYQDMGTVVMSSLQPAQAA